VSAIWIDGVVVRVGIPDRGIRQSHLSLLLNWRYPFPHPLRIPRTIKGWAVLQAAFFIATCYRAAL
jgi:hypothetical protein